MGKAQDFVQPTTDRRAAGRSPLSSNCVCVLPPPPPPTCSGDGTNAQVIAVPWEEIPWDGLAFPTTSWALWHHRLKAEAAAAAQASLGGPAPSRARSTREPGAKSVGLKGGAAPGRIVVAAAGESGKGSGVGSGLEVSQGMVFSTPSSTSSMFWSPDKGLHLKSGWKASTDS